MAWPATLPIVTERLRLEPLTMEHAGPMLEVLADPAIYVYIGGEAPTLPELTRRHRAQSVARIIAPRSQGRAFATEATDAMVDWLGKRE